jgi:multiple antibiotic resistance protein
MVLGHEIFKADKDSKSGSIVPIAFPIIAGSGTLTTIVSLKVVYHQYNILIGILINLIIVFACLRSINFIEKLLGPSGIAVVRKFMGVILLAIAIKIFKSNVNL